MREGTKAWLVGTEDVGYELIKADTRGQARTRMDAADTYDADTWLYLRAIRQPQYDHLPAQAAHDQWVTDMVALYGKGWLTDA